MNALKSGEVVTLTVLEQQASKWILTNGVEELPLNASEVTEPLTVGDRLEVFLFADRRGDLAATTAIPAFTQGEYGWARVLKVVEHEGAFVDIGTSREVLVKAEDLPALKEVWPEPGDHLFMTLRTDRNGDLFGRLATEEKISELYEGAFEDMHNKNIQARPYRLLPIGTFLLGVEVPYRIFVHESERSTEPRLGQDVVVRIIDVKDDGSMNGSLLPRKHERLSNDAQQILNYIQDVGGKMPFGDKSSPEEIQEMFNMSKGAFKRALGTLMKAGKVKQQDGWTEEV
ncbi:MULTISPECIES: S1-like domain-containing RNA-binding protein [Lysinibacillus]|uniref:DNA-binding protein n=1 Tax=Lysinibacillus boronitolerans JCM 21713 = 10a = NBRC 103108 TaxID=1294264 RepID=A0ABR4XV99_9BACI|nr:S1-like domain-containing RNA-binding protein [Lysinibacillus boronitolerans]KGR82300.1 DNA-binding protein [Lysinibacillus boronitolerans JCM 21713 = 10a = NBRC 103108]MCS1394155.1 S1-like domain-containing RNA-binding protein [Lysinibacillus boronitolerans]